eukprot:537277_1
MFDNSTVMYHSLISWVMIISLATSTNKPNFGGCWGWSYYADSENCWYCSYMDYNLNGRKICCRDQIADCVRCQCVDTYPPTGAPTNAPTASPTGTPTNPPTISPTASPTGTPTNPPTISPTASPTGRSNGCFNSTE